MVKIIILSIALEERLLFVVRHMSLIFRDRAMKRSISKDHTLGVFETLWDQHFRWSFACA